MKFNNIYLLLTLAIVSGCTTYTQTHVDGAEKKGKTTLVSNKNQPTKPDGAASITAIQPKNFFDSTLKTLIESITDPSGNKVAGSKFFSWKGYPDLVYLKPDTYKITIQCTNGGVYNFHKFKITLKQDEEVVAFCLPKMSGIMIKEMHAFIVPAKDYSTAKEELNGLLNPQKSKKVENIPGQYIEITPEQKLFVEIIVENGKVVQLLPVTEIKKSDITATFNFTKLDKGMMLSVNNPFPKSMKYNIDMIDSKGNAFQTSSCPVGAGISVFESWPHPITKLEIKNFRFLEDTEEIKCVY
jgi:hypothetical protein